MRCLSSGCAPSVLAVCRRSPATEQATMDHCPSFSGEKKEKGLMIRALVNCESCVKCHRSATTACWYNYLFVLQCFAPTYICETEKQLQQQLEQTITNDKKQKLTSMIQQTQQPTATSVAATATITAVADYYCYYYYKPQ